MTPEICDGNISHSVLIHINTLKTGWPGGQRLDKNFGIQPGGNLLFPYGNRFPMGLPAKFFLIPEIHSADAAPLFPLPHVKKISPHFRRRYAVADQIHGQQSVIFLSQKFMQRTGLASRPGKKHPAPILQILFHLTVNLAHIALYVFGAAKFIPLPRRLRTLVNHLPITAPFITDAINDAAHFQNLIGNRSKRSPRPAVHQNLRIFMAGRVSKGRIILFSCGISALKSAGFQAKAAVHAFRAINLRIQKTVFVFLHGNR